MRRAWRDCWRAIAPSRRSATDAAGETHLEPLFRAREKATVKGLDVSGLTGVISVDPERPHRRRRGHVHLRRAGRPRPCRTGLSPLVVPQLKTITLGGAVTGLGIESASFRNGLPHESVLEMDVLTGFRSS